MDSSQLFLSNTAFAVRRGLAAYRLPMILLAGAGLFLASALVLHFANKEALRAARIEAAALVKRGVPTSVQMAGSAPALAKLKAFQSSHLVAILEQGASTANVKLDEISFAIDDSPNQPYVRYKASFTVVSRYPTIRKFISEILAGSEGVVLDTVACRREDVTVVDVRCDISAYVAYQEKVGG